MPDKMSNAEYCTKIAANLRARHIWWTKERQNYILKMPNLVSFKGAFMAALKLKPRTLLVSRGSMTPSSHSLKERVHLSKKLGWENWNPYLALE